MLDFYCGILGCTVEKTQENFGLVQLRAGSSLLDLVTMKKEPRHDDPPRGAEDSNLDHFCFRIDPFDGAEISAYLARCGVEAGETGSRYGAEGTGPSIYISDPEGNTVELKGPPDPSLSA